MQSSFLQWQFFILRWCKLKIATEEIGGAIHLSDNIDKEQKHLHEKMIANLVYVFCLYMLIPSAIA